MAWDGRDDFGSRDRDPMGVHGDLLFADPLGIRDGGRKTQSSRGPATGSRNEGLYSSVQPPRDEAPRESAGWAPRAGPRRAEEEPRAECLRPEEEEEPWGVLGSLFWYVLAGGKQCCSMRDRTKPADADAKRKAVETGRQPASRFPEPPKPGNGARGGGGRQDGREGSPHSGGFGDEVSRPPPAAANRGAARQPCGRQASADSDSDSEEDPFHPRPDQGRQPHLSTLNGWQPHRDTGARSQQATESRVTGRGAGGADPGRSSDESYGHGGSQHPPSAVNSTGGFGAGARSQDSAVAPAATGAVSSSLQTKGDMPRRWEWPAWCLNFKDPCIEVYVVDDDTGEGRWVDGEPQSRVVDKGNRDAYLCVEYEWDNEYYVQDFGPQHVRRRGQQSTVFELFERGGGAGDTGGGISAFLGSD